MLGGAGDLGGIVESTVRQVLEQVELLRAIATEFSLLGRPGDLETEPLDLPALVRHVTSGYAGDAAAEELSVPELVAEALPSQ